MKRGRSEITEIEDKLEECTPEDLLHLADVLAEKLKAKIEEEVKLLGYKFKTVFEGCYFKKLILYSDGSYMTFRKGYEDHKRMEFPRSGRRCIIVEGPGEQYMVDKYIEIVEGEKVEGIELSGALYNYLKKRLYGW